jgi:hypothetical protein
VKGMILYSKPLFIAGYMSLKSGAFSESALDTMGMTVELYIYTVAYAE